MAEQHVHRFDVGALVEEGLTVGPAALVQVKAGDAGVLAYPTDHIGDAVGDELAFPAVLQGRNRNARSSRMLRISRHISRHIRRKGTQSGLKKPDISPLLEESLVEMRKLPQRNLAVELLNKLLSDEVRRTLGRMLSRLGPSPLC